MRIPVRYHGARVDDADDRSHPRAAADAEKEPTMTNDHPPTPQEPDAQSRGEADDSYEARHVRPDTPEQEPTGVPNGWPGEQRDLPPAGRPTSPTSGAASAAAARAAYADASQGRPTPPEETVPPQPEAAPPGPDVQPQPAAPEEPTSPADASALEGEAAKLAQERLADLQRLQAEYVNYKRRVDRDREVVKELAVVNFIDSLLPVLDEITLARQHGELEGGPFAKIAEKLEAVLVRQGVVRFGEVGEEFDPTVHEALMHTQAELPEGTTATTVVMVMQPGYRVGDRVVRPARVSVADPA